MKHKQREPAKILRLFDSTPRRPRHLINIHNYICCMYTYIHIYIYIYTYIYIYIYAHVYTHL